LPWSPKLQEFIDDPSPVIELLELLKEDESLYVRRSVANNLNDIAKDSPDLVVETLKEWKKVKNEGTQWIIKHASRTLAKDGNQEILSILGFDSCENLKISNFEIEPKEVKMGEDLQFKFDLTSNEKESVDLMIDYSIHFMKSNGKTNPKVFKLSKKNVEPGKTLKLTKKQSFKPISTRKYYPGKHFVEIIINGSKMGKYEFNLKK
jgi:3-methyladenine DNA glycosylase AlkD